MLNLQLNNVDNFLNRLFVLQEEVAFVLRVSADDSRKSEGALAVRVLLDAGQGGALEERLRRGRRLS